MLRIVLGMEPTVVGQVWMLVALAELGDKSQLLCMSLATRWPGRSVFLGAALAFALLNVLAVGVGATLGDLVNPAWASGAAGLLMVGLAVSMLWSDSDDDEDEDSTALPADSSLSPLLRTAGLIALAELGDKTQLEVAALATVWPTLSVWTGATLALVTTTALGVWLGVLARDRLPTRRLQQAGAVLLLGVGLLLVANAAMALRY